MILKAAGVLLSQAEGPFAYNTARLLSSPVAAAAVTAEAVTVFCYR